MTTSDQPAFRGLRAFMRRTARNRVNGVDTRYGYIALNTAIVVAGMALLLWQVGSVATLWSPVLWGFVAIRAALFRMTTEFDTAGNSFLFDDFIMILAVFVLPHEQWAAFALFTVATWCWRVRCFPSAVAVVRSALEWNLSLMLGALPFALWGHGLWAVVGGGIAGLACANVVYAFGGSLAKIFNFDVPARQAMREVVRDLRDGVTDSALAEFGIGVPLAALCWTAFRYSPWAVLLVMVPYVVIWSMVRRNLQAREVERELAEAKERIGRDSLSGLFNRERFTDAAVQRLVEARRGGEPVSLVMLDLDHFKRLNDTHGHQAGDRAIVGAAATLAGTVAEHGVAGRYGGEEFIALVGLDSGAAVDLAEQLRGAVAEALVEHATTASIGITHLDPTARDTGSDTPAHDYVWASHTLEQLIAQADDALYAAKHGGRNQVAEWAGDGIAAAA